MNSIKVGDIIEVTKVYPYDKDTRLKVGWKGEVTEIDLGQEIDVIAAIMEYDPQYGEEVLNLREDGSYLLYIEQIKVIDSDWSAFT